MRVGKITVRFGRRGLERELKELFGDRGLRVLELRFEARSRVTSTPEPKKPFLKTLGEWTIVAEEEDEP